MDAASLSGSGAEFGEKGGGGQPARHGCRTGSTDGQVDVTWTPPPVKQGESPRVPHEDPGRAVIPNISPKSDFGFGWGGGGGVFSFTCTCVCVRLCVRVCKTQEQHRKAVYNANIQKDVNICVQVRNSGLAWEGCEGPEG